MHGDLGLVELVLDPQEDVGLVGVLVLCEILLQLGHGEVPGRPRRGLRIGRQELVQDSVEEAVRGQLRVFKVRGDDAADAF